MNRRHWLLLAPLTTPARFVAAESVRTVVAAEALRGDGSALSMGWVRSQFRRTDDGSGGRLQTLRRSLKFWWRCWWHAAPLGVSTRAFRESRLDSIVESEPTLPLRPLRSYLRRGLDPSRRAQAVQSHFAWLSSHFSMPWIDRLYTGETFALLPGAPLVEGLGLTLSCARHLGREGELAIHLEWQGERAMSVAFSVIDSRLVVASATLAPRLTPSAGPRAVIGSIQGTRGADARLRELSAATQRLRPGALLVLAVQALSDAWGLEPPLGVATSSHVYAGYASRRRQVALDYDATWRDAGGMPLGRHYWALPAQTLLRPDSEVESRRRAQHRRRNALRTSLQETVQRSAGALLLPPSL